MSQTISLSGNTSKLDRYFYPPLKVGFKAEIELLSLHTDNYTPNIEFGCNTCNKCFIINGETKLIEIPTGCYEINTLETQIKELLSQNTTTGIFENVYNLTSNSSLMKCLLYCDYDVVLNVKNSIASLLGFSERNLKAGETHVFDKTVNIMKVNCIKVNCNLTFGSFSNGVQLHTIHEFYPSVSPGYKLIEIPRYHILYKLKTSTISYVRVSLKDQNGKLINLRGETLNICLHIKNGTEI